MAFGTRVSAVVLLSLGGCELRQDMLASPVVASPLLGLRCSEWVRVSHSPPRLGCRTGTEHVPFRTLSSEQEGHQRGGEIVGPLRLKSGGGGPLTVICLDKRGFCHSVSGTLGETKALLMGGCPLPKKEGAPGRLGALASR